MAEKKYIELKKALNVCNMHYQHYLLETDFDKCTVVECVVDDIETIPTADVEEVRHGEWQIKSRIHRFMEEIDQDFYVECPFCKRDYYVPFEVEDKKMLEYAREHYPYCHCGAKMDGGKANDL